MNRRRLLDEMISRLDEALGEEAYSAVLYGPAAHGDARDDGELNLMIVLADLEPPTLARLQAPVRWWLKKGQPWPRLFSPRTIEESQDVFPIEFLDIARHHEVLRGSDPFADLDVDASHLRLQCERELREKMMRLREAYVEAAGKDKRLGALLVRSYSSFTLIFRGCLHALGAEVPVHDRDVARAFCRELELEAGPFDEVEKLASGEAAPDDLAGLFRRYYQELTSAVSHIDRFDARAASREAAQSARQERVSP